MLNLKNPLVVFDLETTGTNTSKDRIVEIALIKIFPDGKTEEKCRRINPGIPIPIESSLVHGIYDKDVKDEPSFNQVAKSMSDFLENCDLCGFNILQFDIPLLAQEFARVGIDFNTDKRNLLDAQKIFHMMEKRNLSAAFKFYTGEVLENAHSALADTRATMAVFMGQIAKYDRQTLSNLKGEVLGIIENDMSSLHLLLNKKMVDLAGRMVFNDQGKEVFNFGKHKGKLVSEVLQKESSFYDWMMKGDFPLDTKKKLTQLRLNSFNK